MSTSTISFGVITELNVNNEIINITLDVTNNHAAGSGQPVGLKTDRGTAVFSGRMLEGQRLPVVALLQEYIPELDAPNSIKNLSIDQLRLEIRPDYGSFAFDCGISNLWEITLDSGPTLAMRQLQLSLVSVSSTGQGSAPTQSTAIALSQQRRLSIAGDFELFGGTFTLAVNHYFSALSLAELKDPAVSERDRRRRQKAITTPDQLWSFWSFSASASNIDLKELIKAFGFSDADLEFGLESFVIETLQFQFTRAQRQLSGQTTAQSESEYSFLTAFSWDTGVSLDGNDTLLIDARVEVSKVVSFNSQGQQESNLVGQVTGSATTSIPLFDSLQLRASYIFSRTASAAGGAAQRSQGLELEIYLGRIGLRVVYTSEQSRANERTLTFSPRFLDADGNSADTITFGEILATVVSLFDSSFDNFELDPPWDALGNQAIALSDFGFQIDLNTKKFSVIYTDSLDLFFFKVSNLNLALAGASQAKKGVRIGLRLSVPGLSPQTVEWDPVNENPPSVPGEKAPLIDLQFLALGQHVSFAPEIVAQARTINQVMNTMRQTMVALPPAQRRRNPLTALQDALPPAPVSVDPTAPISYSGEPIQFNAESGWLIGAQFSVIGTFSLSLIFNDPLIYGVRIALSGAKAKIFAGLEFEILYRRISDTVGVYHTELTLPDAMRQLEFGAVSITLPVVAIDIYTNGDFGIDFGFPWQGDFSRSFGVQAFPFIGSGGFYFYKLSAETATSTPVIINGEFDPVLEFGIGLKIGLGKSFNKGVLKAELSVSVHGILQGVIAWFQPSDPAVSSDQYYKIQGGVSIVGRLYGVVDFSVISVDIEVIVQVTVLFVVEAYQPIQLAIEAKVSVRASIKIAFVRIRFSFRLTVRQDFTLGSASPTPWRLASGSGVGAMPALGTASRPRYMAPVHRGKIDGADPRVLKEPWDLNPAHGRDIGLRGVEARSPELTPPQPSLRPTDTLRESQGEGAGPSASPVDSEVTPPQSERPVSPLSKGGLRGVTQNIANAPTSTPTATPSATTTDQTSISQLPEGIQSLTWSDPDLGLTGNDGIIDLYFQVAAAVNSNDGQTPSNQGIALLFIENFIPTDMEAPQEIEALDHQDTDFDRLAKGLLQWAIATYSPTTNVASPSTVTLNLDNLEGLYASLIQHFDSRGSIAPFVSSIDAFFKENFVFRISDRPETERTLSGSIFPMIPFLTLTMGTTTIDFDGSSYQRTDANIQVVKAYTRNLLVSHGSTVERSDSSASTDTGATLSMAEFMFADYIAMLMRLTVQSAIDTVEAAIEASGQSRLSYTTTLSSLLNDLNSTASFKHLAGTVSRFFLHGLRVPVSTATGTSRTDLVGMTTQGLYEATGQQFNVTVSSQTADDGTTTRTVAVGELVLRDSDDKSWIQFIDYNGQETTTSDLELTYTLDSETETLMEQLSVVSLTGVTGKTQAPELMPFYNDVNPRYSLRQKRQWQQGASGAVTHTLFDFSSDLCTLLQANPTGLDLTLTSNTTSAGKTVDVDNESSITSEWSTKIPLTIRRVKRVTDGQPLPHTYLMVGTDAGGRSLLDTVLTELASNTDNSRPVITLLYGGNGGVISDPDAQVLLLKTNLAILDDTPVYFSTPSGDASDRNQFLTMLLESSLQEAKGYHLYYRTSTAGDAPGFPDTIFQDGDEGQLILLIQQVRTDGQAMPFHNCVSVAIADDPQATDNGGGSDTDVVIESPSTVKTLSIPAGNVGFKLAYPAIDIESPDNNPNDASYELANLYQLLSYRLPATTTFNGSADGLPLGPAEENFDTNQIDQWIYERVVPAYTFAKAGSTESSALTVPSPHLNPYRGVSDSAAIALDFYWQDIYGNRLNSNPSLSQSLDVRYFDELLNLNQWPSVTESYGFEPGTGTTVDLCIELVLDQGKYLSTPGTNAADVAQKISSDRALYETIYYQVHQSADHQANQFSTSFTAEVSFLGTGSGASYTPHSVTLAAATFTNFVDRVYEYLATLETLTPYSHTVAANDTLATVAGDYHVSLSDLGSINGTLETLFAAATTLQIPVEWAIASATRTENNVEVTVSTDTLTTIAEGLLTAENILNSSNYATVRAIATLVAPETDNIAPYRPDGSVGGADRSLVLAKVNEIVALYGDTPNLLVEGTVITVGSNAPYTVQNDDTLNTLQTNAGATVEQLADITELLPPNTIIGVQLAYTMRATDSLSTIQQKVTLLATHTYLSFEANQLDIGAIASENQAIALAPGLNLLIPHRVELTTAGLGYTSRQRDLDAIAQDFSEADKPVTAADVAIANQTLHGIIQAGVNILPTTSYLYALSQVLPVTTTDANLLSSANTRTHETFSSLKDQFTELIEVFKTSITDELKWISALEVDIDETEEQFATSLNSNASVVFSTDLQADLTTAYDRLAAIQIHYPSADLPTLLISELYRGDQSSPDTDQGVFVQLTGWPDQPAGQVLTRFKLALKLLIQVYTVAQHQLGNRTTFAQVTEAIAPIANLLVTSPKLIKPPFTSTTVLNIDRASLTYPDELITPISVRVNFNRPTPWVHPSVVTTIPTTQRATALLSPKVAPITADKTDEIASLKPFTTAFQSAFPDLHLAISGQNQGCAASSSSSSNATNATNAIQSLWAVRFGDQGVTYNIHESLPFFFTAAPLANTLIGGQVKQTYTFDPTAQSVTANGFQTPAPDDPEAEAQRVDGTDLNVLAREFLVAVEAFLKPESAITARQDSTINAASSVDAIIQAKNDLATTISTNQVTHILDLSQDSDELRSLRDQRQAVAQSALQRELRTNLVDGYDIETIIQYNVDVDIAADASGSAYPWRQTTAQSVAPRFVGQPVVRGTKQASTGESLTTSQSLDFNLSPATIGLDTSADENLSNLTFFFNTKTPERYEDLELILSYRAKELEYNIDPEHHTATSLSFVLPIDDDYRLTPQVIARLTRVRLPAEVITALTAQQGQRWTAREQFIYDMDRLLTTVQVNGAVLDDTTRQSYLDIIIVQADFSTSEDYRISAYVLTQVTTELNSSVGQAIATHTVTQQTINAWASSLQPALQPMIGDTWNTRTEFITDLTALFPTTVSDADREIILALLLKYGSYNNQDTYQITNAVMDLLRSDIADTAVTDALATLVGQSWIAKEDFLDDVQAAFTQAGLGTDPLTRYRWTILVHADFSVPHHIGDVQIPIPLRTYPLPPSLIMQAAEADPDSVVSLTQVREWQYTYLYEHPNVAQDAIETWVGYNQPAQLAPIANQQRLDDPDQETLFDTLVRFSILYPQLQFYLNKLAQDDISSLDPNGTIIIGIRNAIAAFTILVTDVTTAWSQWPTPADQLAEQQAAAQTGTLAIADYTINETIPLDDATRKIVDITIRQTTPALDVPLIDLPDYQLDPADQNQQQQTQQAQYTFTQLTDLSGVTTFGESDIPDRKVIIQNRDIINHQNAWSALWITRNKALIPSMTTNEAFVFQTPQVRFKNRLSPLLTNQVRWDVATLNSTDGTPQNRPLLDHITQLFQTILPERSDRPYDIRIGCQYAFALVLGDPGLDDDLLSLLPVLLSPRFAIATSASDADSTMTTQTDQLRENIRDQIQFWYESNLPVKTQGRYIFTLSIFSSQTATESSTDSPNLPLLKIEHLSLALDNIDEYR
ncbi:MAG: LysM peptidoglycan-binding domain-containing protein [Cyanobacteria bacterium P01_F01_bin.150]